MNASMLSSSCVLSLQCSLVPGEPYIQYKYMNVQGYAPVNSDADVHLSMALLKFKLHLTIMWCLLMRPTAESNALTDCIAIVLNGVGLPNYSSLLTIA